MKKIFTLFGLMGLMAGAQAFAENVQIEFVGSANAYQNVTVTNVTDNSVLEINASPYSFDYTGDTELLFAPKSGYDITNVGGAAMWTENADGSWPVTLTSSLSGTSIQVVVLEDQGGSTEAKNITVNFDCYNLNEGEMVEGEWEYAPINNLIASGSFLGQNVTVADNSCQVTYGVNYRGDAAELTLTPAEGWTLSEVSGWSRIGVMLQPLTKAPKVTDYNTITVEIPMDATTIELYIGAVPQTEAETVEYVLTPENHSVLAEITTISIEFPNNTNVAYYEGNRMPVAIIGAYLNGETELTEYYCYEPDRNTRAESTGVVYDFNFVDEDGNPVVINQNGNWELTIRAFYLETADGEMQDLPVITANYQVDTESGVATIAPAEVLNVYTINGVQVVKNGNAASLTALTPGIYVVNGRKVVIR